MIDLSGLNENQKKAVTHGDEPFMLVAGPGCITGDTVINFNRCAKGFSMTIREAYRAFKQKRKVNLNWDLKHDTYVRSFQGDQIKLHKINAIVYSGKRVVYRLKLKNGLEVKATSDHKIMTNDGFVELGKLNKKHLVMCDQKNSVNAYKNFNQGIPHFSEVESVKEIGEKKTYDIQCDYPWHNFVANGIVIHNSGKTRCLTMRVAYLINKGVLPSRLFVTTFTNKAAEEMTERLVDMVGQHNTDRLRIGTSHSLFFKIYKDILDDLGIFNYPKLMMGGGRWMTMVSIINSHSISKGVSKFFTKNIASLLSQISWWKNEALTPEDVEKKLKEDGVKLVNSNGTFSEWGTYLQAYYDYEKKLKAANKIDFDDMLLRPYLLLQDKNNAKILKKIRKRIDYVIVDEAQDLNKIQFLLVETITGENNKVGLIFDDWQQIFSFRGANIENLFEFKDKYNPAIIKLERNYRSTKRIVQHGNKLIGHNKKQMEKVVYTENEEGSKVHVIVSDNEDAESVAIIDKIQDLVIDGYDLKDIAILYRTNAQSRALVDQLIVQEIPHKVYSNMGFYDRAEIKDIISYLKIICTPEESDLYDFKRVINKPARYLGKKFLDEVEDYEIDHDYECFWYALRDFPTDNLSNLQRARCNEFVSLIKDLSERVANNDITTSNAIRLVVSRTGYDKWLLGESQEEESPDEDKELNLESLYKGAERFERPEDFLLFVDGLKDVDETNSEDDYCHLMTHHKSKGQEFPIVIVAGLSTRLMPHHKAESIEEERRIAFVAITRAEEKLYISTINGRYGRFKVMPSPFIKEMGVSIPGINLNSANQETNNKPKEEKKELTMQEQIDKIQEIMAVKEIMAAK